MKITAAIISDSTKLNEQLLESLTFVDEIIIVIDSSISRHRNDNVGKTKIFYHSLNCDFSAQRNFALQKAKSDWVLFVDDDEYVGTELAREIIDKIRTTKYSGYMIPRVDVVHHQPLLHGETGQIKLLRLGLRKSGKFFRPVHEKWKIKGGVGELTSPLYHIKDHFISEFLHRMSEYGKIDAKVLKYEGKPFSWFRLICFPVAKFKVNYLLKAGFLDGLAGLFLAYLMAVQSLTVRIFQWENQK